MAAKIKLGEGAYMPTRGTEGSAGLDLYSKEARALFPGTVYKLDTGVAIQLQDPKAYMMVVSRSSVASKGLIILNSPGIVDNDYRGNIIVTMFNLTDRPIVIDRGERIAQIIIGTTPDLELEVVAEITPTTRGQGGFGSTGK